MTYLEKLAKAARDHEWEGNDRKCDWEAEDKAYWIASVRAILTAMMEATPKMVLDGADCFSLVYYGATERCWQTMIQAALNEPLSEE